MALVRTIVEKQTDPDTHFESSGNVDDLLFSLVAALLNTVRLLINLKQPVVKTLG